jgi:hypothetical protein
MFKLVFGEPEDGNDPEVDSAASKRSSDAV